MNTARALSLLSLLLVACTSSAPEAGTPLPGAPPADLSGTWAFSLDASDVAPQLRASCKGDEACYAAIRAEASQEKIRFASDARGKTVWSSFGPEEVFVEAPVELEQSGPGLVLAKIAGPAHGRQAAQLEKAGVRVMRIEIVDARTIAMVDPRKGRLVYAKE